MKTQKLSDLIGNGTRDIEDCSVVSQVTTLPRALNSLPTVHTELGSTQNKTNQKTLRTLFPWAM